MVIGWGLYMDEPVRRGLKVLFFLLVKKLGKSLLTFSISPIITEIKVEKCDRYEDVTLEWLHYSIYHSIFTIDEYILGI